MVTGAVQAGAQVDHRCAGPGLRVTVGDVAIRAGNVFVVAVNTIGMQCITITADVCAQQLGDLFYCCCCVVFAAKDPTIGGGFVCEAD